MLKHFFSRTQSSLTSQGGRGQKTKAGRVRSRSDGFIGNATVDSTLPLRKTAELPALTDTLWDHVLYFLDEPSLLLIAQCSHRFKTLSKTALIRMGRPDPVRCGRATERICNMLTEVKFARNIYRNNDDADFGSSHPFWSTPTSRLRLLLCGAFEKDSGYSGVAELRLLHGRQHYYAILMSPTGKVLCGYSRFDRRSVQKIITHFHKISKGDYVVAYKNLSPPSWYKQVEGMSERIKEHKDALRGRGGSRQGFDEDGDHDEETLSIDRDASVEFGYLSKQVGTVLII